MSHRMVMWILGSVTGEPTKRKLVTVLGDTWPWNLLIKFKRQTLYKGKGGQTRASASATKFLFDRYVEMDDWSNSHD